MCMRFKRYGAGETGTSAFVLVCIRLCHMADGQWDGEKYMNIKHLDATVEESAYKAKLSFLWTGSPVHRSSALVQTRLLLQHLHLFMPLF